MSKDTQLAEKYNIGEVWWVVFPYRDKPEFKHRPGIIIDSDTVAIMYVTSKCKDTPYSIEIADWNFVGLPKQSWARIDRIIQINECNIESKIGELSERDCTKILQLTKEYLSGVCHEFSIIAIKNNLGEFLQIFDSRWNNWLFPYVASSEENKANVDFYVSDLLKRDISTTYVTASKHCKYSESDEIYKIYNHKLYSVTLPDDLCKTVVDGSSNMKWMSIKDLESNSSIMDSNEDVIGFVKANC